MGLTAFNKKRMILKNNKTNYGQLDKKQIASKARMIRNILNCPTLEFNEQDLLGMSQNKLSGLNSWAVINTHKGVKANGATNENNGGANHGSNPISGVQST